MSINNKWTDITRADLLALAQNVNIRRASQIIEQVVAGVSLWPRLAKEYGIPKDIADAIGATLQLKL